MRAVDLDPIAAFVAAREPEAQREEADYQHGTSSHWHPPDHPCPSGKISTLCKGTFAQVCGKGGAVPRRMSREAGAEVSITPRCL